MVALQQPTSLSFPAISHARRIVDGTPDRSSSSIEGVIDQPASRAVREVVSLSMQVTHLKIGTDR